MLSQDTVHTNDVKWIYVPLIYEDLKESMFSELSKSQNAPSIIFEGDVGQVYSETNEVLIDQTEFYTK